VDDLRRDEGLTPEPVAPDGGTPDGSGSPGGDEGDELRVSPASPSDLEDDLPAFQPGEGPGQTPGE
jgi:hypothetical protein